MSSDHPPGEGPDDQAPQTSEVSGPGQAAGPGQNPGRGGDTGRERPDLPAATWASDPMGRHELRWWDGALWTDHVSSGGQVTVDPLNPVDSNQQSLGPAVGTAPPVRPWYKKKRWWALGGLVVLFIGIAVASDEGGDDETETAGGGGTTTEATTETTEADAGLQENAAPTTEPPTTTTEATTTTTTEPEGPGDGVHEVGTDVAPGLYVAEPSGLCYWARLSGFGGETVDDIIANDNPAGEQAIVEIAETDVGFESSGCGAWSVFDESSREPVTSFGDGDWAVGIDIEPGTYRSEGGELCYWERASGFGHGTIDEVLANDLPSGQALVDIDASDARFTASGCGTWERQ